MKRASKRFQPGKWMEFAIPLLLGLLLLGLVATLVIIVLAVAGVMPAG